MRLSDSKAFPRWPRFSRWVSLCRLLPLFLACGSGAVASGRQGG